MEPSRILRDTCGTLRDTHRNSYNPQGHSEHDRGKGEKGLFGGNSIRLDDEISLLIVIIIAANILNIFSLI